MRGMPRTLLLALLLAGCASPVTDRAAIDPEVVAQEQELQRRLVLQRDFDYQQRLSSIAFDVRQAAVPLCFKDWGRETGFEIGTLRDFEQVYWPAANQILGVDEQVRLTAVRPGSAADDAGLETGDVLVAVNKVAITPGMMATKTARSALRDASRSGKPVELIVRRDGRNILVTLTPDPICDYAPILARQEGVNAYADGENIFVTRGMMRFAATDDELALVIAHELAHNAMDHIEAQRGNQMLGSVLDLAASAYGMDTRGVFGDLALRTHSRSFEAEADYVALYILARGGIAIDEAADFWRRMAIEHPESIEGSYLATHPSTAVRYVAIEDTVEEIAAKLRNDEDLMPNVRQRPRRFDQAPLAMSFGQALDIETLSSGSMKLPGGCWRSAGKVREGRAYRPESGAITIHGQDALLIVRDGRAIGLWQMRKQRFLALGEPLSLDDVAEPHFECLAAR